MVERIVVDHVDYVCSKCGHAHLIDVTVPRVCPACEIPTPYYLEDAWHNGASLVLYRKRPADASPVQVCIFADNAATVSDETRRYAEQVLDLLSDCEM